jgi:hypothetical protein
MTLGQIRFELHATQVENCKFQVAFQARPAVEHHGHPTHVETSATSGGTVQIQAVEPSGKSKRQANELKNIDSLKDEYSFDYQRFTSDYFEYEQGQKKVVVRSRLRQQIDFFGVQLVLISIYSM